MADSAGFGDFVIESVIGEGGMGRVYRARQVNLDRWVALKVLPRAQENPAFIERFYREARSAARLVHPNIIQIHTVGEVQGIPYFAMEYIEGEDLENILQFTPEPLNTNELVEIMRSVAKALTVASEHGIVHRDIKPANIMITRSGLVKVMDFGLAKGVDHSLTQAGMIVGTPSYISPEQGASKAVDTRSDIYSLGCVLYKCIAGHPPFEADNVAALLYKHMYEAPEPLVAEGRTVDPAIDQVCMKMLEKDPAQRYQNPAEMLEALAAVYSNSALAELTLSKRVIAAQRARKEKQVVPGAMVVPEGPVGAGVKTPPPATHPPHPPLPRTTAAPRSPAPFSPTSMAVTRLESGLHQVGITPVVPQAEKADATLEGQRVDAAEAILDLPPPPPLPPAQRGTGSKTGARKHSFSEVLPTRSRLRVNEVFVKLPDGRWSYKLEQGRCLFVEGIAAQLPRTSAGADFGKPNATPTLGDCLLCSNWNKRLGCALAYSQELEVRSAYSGLKLVIEQIIGWIGAGRYDRAVLQLETHIKNNPNDSEAYRELARIYEKPEYKCNDKRRAIVLYQRFAELARKSGGVSNVEIQRAEERAKVLITMPAERKSSLILAGAGIAFHCFYRGPVVCFSYGVLMNDKLVVVRAGEVDPETGVLASDMGGAMNKASTLFRRFKSEQAKKDEQAGVKKELQRLSNLSLEDLQTDSAKVLFLFCEQMNSVDMSVDNAIGTRCITIKAQQQTHQLLFNEDAAFKADQCYEILRRVLAK